MAKWEIKEKLSKQRVNLPSIHPVVLDILNRKGFKSREEMEKFLDPDYDRDLHDPFLFSEMDKALERIDIAKKESQKVLIFGDYDADGITSSTILFEALRDFGIEAEVYIPDKHIEGYGMNSEAIKKFAKKKVKLIITVDCGIANTKEVGEATKLGIDTIVIDHHHILPEVPEAYCIINPKIEKSGYPFDMLAGVGVTFKFVQGIYKKFMPEKKEQLKWMLDLVAIGTVADCVPLLDENRVLVKYGLLVLSKTKNIGLQEIFKVGRISIDENNVPDSRKISFQIAPRINAAGRMDHANIAYNLVNESDRVEARNLALELEQKNQERQKVTSTVTGEVEKLAHSMFKDKNFIFAGSEHFPVGVVGLVAGRIADQFNKPTVIFQKQKDVSKGSFRSIPSLNIIELIEKCSNLLVEYGGHAQAAGVEVKNENLEKFYEKMDSLINKELEEKNLEAKIEIDAELKPEDIDFKLTEGMNKLKPFGEENEEPKFLMKDLVIKEKRILGNGDKHLKLFLWSDTGSPKVFEAIGFKMADNHKRLKEGDKIDIVFNIQEDEWNGNKKISLVLVDIKK